MGSKKKTTTANTHTFITPPVTPQVTQAQSIADSLRNKVNPMIRGFYAGERDKLNSGFVNPMGAATTPAMREATLKAGNEELSQNEAQALAGAEHQAGASDFERQMALVAATNPQLVNSGSTQTQSGGGGFTGMLGQLGSAAIM